MRERKLLLATSQISIAQRETAQTKLLLWIQQLQCTGSLEE